MFPGCKCERCELTLPRSIQYFAGVRMDPLCGQPGYSLSVIVPSLLPQCIERSSPLCHVRVHTVPHFDGTIQSFGSFSVKLIKLCHVLECMSECYMVSKCHTHSQPRKQVFSFSPGPPSIAHSTLVTVSASALPCSACDSCPRARACHTQQPSSSRWMCMCVLNNVPVSRSYDPCTECCGGFAEMFLAGRGQALRR